MQLHLKLVLFMEKYFEKFRKNIIGHDQVYLSPYGNVKIVYADWVASGRLYAPIEEKITNTFGPFVANTHTESSETGNLMTKAYHLAHLLPVRMLLASLLRITKWQRSCMNMTGFVLLILQHLHHM